jgi:predicted ATP-grasp superfamily ATP-dependent carboligase
MQTRERILITDGETRAVLAAVRGLHAAGFEVAVAAAESVRPAPALWSRGAADRLLVPHPLEHEAGFVGALERALASSRFALLMPGSDASLLAISRARGRLEGHAAIGLPSRAAVERALDKPALMTAAACHGLRSPETLACAGIEDALAAAEAFGFPVVVKPLCSVVDRGEPARCHVGSLRAEDQQSLAAAVRACGERCLVQRNAEGPILSVAGVYAQRELLGETVSRYRRTWYPDAGNVCFSETIAMPSELRERVVGLMEALEWEGLFELELIARRDGGWSAIDLNPRPYGSLALAIGAGANLPAVWARQVLSGRSTAAPARPGVLYRWEDADFRHALWQLRRLHWGRAAAALRIHRHVVHPFFRLHDPGPFAARALFLLAALRGRVRRRPAPVAKQDIRDPDPDGMPANSRSVSEDAPVVVIGAGPYGLAAAAHLRAADVPLRAFGEPMGFWRRNMPEGMLLRSPRRATHIAAPGRGLSIDRYEQERRTTVRRPTLRLEEFVDYGQWFQRRAVPGLDSRRVTRVERDSGVFSVTLEDGERFEASRVVVAAGLSRFASCPEPFHSLPGALVSHACEHDDLSVFSGRQVAVIGAGQSALESAALLAEHGAAVEVLVRAGGVTWLPDDTQPQRAAVRRLIPIPPPPTGVGGRLTGWIAALPDAFRRAPSRLRAWVSGRCVRPMGSGWLRSRLEGVTITCGRFVAEARAHEGRAVLLLDDGSERSVDHVLLGTGYEIDVRGYEFLDPVADEIDAADGYPTLGPGLESSVPGLHFLGAASSLSFGPIMRFVVGAWYAAPALTAHVLGRRQRPLRRAF